MVSPWYHPKFGTQGTLKTDKITVAQRHPGVETHDTSKFPPVMQKGPDRFLPWMNLVQDGLDRPVPFVSPFVGGIECESVPAGIGDKEEQAAGVNAALDKAVNKTTPQRVDEAYEEHLVSHRTRHAIGC